MDAQGASNVSAGCLAQVRGAVAASVLAEQSILERYCAWRGGSDQRYVATVYPVDRRRPAAGLPEFESFVLIAVSRHGGVRRVLDVSTIERDSDRLTAVSLGLAAGADEWHVHLLAADRRDRAALVADLLARHRMAGQARCA